MIFVPCDNNYVFETHSSQGLGQHAKGKIGDICCIYSHFIFLWLD
jgi:hypothetical protein